VLFLLIGIPGLVLPFVQGVIFIALGVALLSTFSPTAGRIIGGYKQRYPFVALHLDRAENRIERWLRRPTHTMSSVTITGYAGRKLAVMVDQAKEQRLIVVLMHGVGGYKEQPVLRAMADAFADMGATVVRFDAANGVGESSGSYVSGTATSMMRDISSVMEWIETMPWRGNSSVWLSGHSLGGLCVLEYAAQHPSRVAGVVSVAGTISGELSVAAMDPAIHAQWKQLGYREDKIAARSPKNRLPYSHLEDRMGYDITKRARQLLMPVFIVVGTDDVHTPPVHQQQLYVRLPGEKRLCIVPGMPHTPIAHADIDSLKDEIRTFIRYLETI
jgi:pimeloyl-ACP methyl ester carboxylesterase